MRKGKQIQARRSDVESWISEGQSKAFMCRELSCKQDTLNTALTAMGIDYVGNQPSRGKGSPLKMTAAQYAATNFPNAHKLRLKILEDGLRPHRCEVCLRTTWNGYLIPLELHHVNGDRFNNNFSNLLLLCPNCHAQTDNHAGKGKRKTKGS